MTTAGPPPATFDDPAFIAAVERYVNKGLMLFWKHGAAQRRATAEAIEQLRTAGIPIEQRIASASSAQITAEADRLIRLKGGVTVYITGPNAQDTRVNITVAKGSFAEAVKKHTDVLIELAPRVPVAVYEGWAPYTS